MNDAPLQKWECIACGYVYDEAAGDPDGGIAPGTRWKDIPDDWTCPDCGISKGRFHHGAGRVSDPLAASGT